MFLYIFGKLRAIKFDSMLPVNPGLLFFPPQIGPNIRKNASPLMRKSFQGIIVSGIKQISRVLSYTSGQEALQRLFLLSCRTLFPVAAD